MTAYLKFKTATIKLQTPCILHSSSNFIRVSLIAFVKERFHNAVEIDILGIFEGYSSYTNLAPPKNFSGAKLFRANDVISIKHVLCTYRSFDLRLGVLPCRVWPSRRVWCAFLSNSGLCFLVCLFSRTRSPMLSDVNRGNSCIWLHLLT